MQPRFTIASAINRHRSGRIYYEPWKDCLWRTTSRDFDSIATKDGESARSLQQTLIKSGKVRHCLITATYPSHILVSASTISVGRFGLKTHSPLKLDGLDAMIVLNHLPTFNISALQGRV